MPKQTFFNLPEAKRHTLMRAAEEEFSRAPLYEASIANIVKTAGIPRGSFYQYFADKEDAFFYLLDHLSHNRKTIFIELLKQHNGDLIEAVKGFFQLVITEDDNPDFVRNALLNMTYQIEDVIARIFCDQTNQEEFREISSLVDKTKLNIGDEKDIFHIIQILASVLVRNLVDTFARNLSYQTATDHLTVEMNLLKSGVYR
ncbi:TetR family transcriptional regulator [Barrientosiimonas marina]|uniref:TetR/AcrR family transcriptional regulator n=1 Tax=Lentibacillus kimchii TaxID=1542911 RepID=A0ABW2UVY1_9BACI